MKKLEEIDAESERKMQFKKENEKLKIKQNNQGEQISEEKPRVKAEGKIKEPNEVTLRMEKIY